MHISFNNEQYRALLGMIHIADWIINGDFPPQERIAAFANLKNYVLGFSREFGIWDDVAEDKNGDYHLSEQSEISERLNEFLDHYDDDIFWHELSLRFAEREIEKKYPEGEWMTLSEEMKKTISRNTENRYRKYFEKNGLKTLILPENTDGE